ncbi:MAG: dTDP-4-amino-4,6-dideoxygalactose transaminase [Alphaproteobacteria bacterium]
MNRRPAPIPFNRAHLNGRELDNIKQAYSKGRLSGNGHFSKLCEVWLETQTQAKRALLTHSCTGALEMTALLLDIAPGDEVIMPAYTFVSTANAVVLRGGVPVFADIRTDTLNIDETKIEALITPRTRSIWPVHYAGVACEMDPILSIANKHSLSVVEDAAQGIMATYKGRPLGSMGDFGTFSFHETKNVTCGEGGALLINKERFIHRAEIIHEKGTDRREFSRGHVDRYTWQDIGSSFTLGELAAAFLHSQFETARSITDQRLVLWKHYHEALKPLEKSGHLRRPVIPVSCQHNAHMYYVILARDVDRAQVLTALKEKGVQAVFHYVPLGKSPAGGKFTKRSTELPVTEDLSTRIIRLPLWADMTLSQVEYVCESLTNVLTR